MIFLDIYFLRTLCIPINMQGPYGPSEIIILSLFIQNSCEQLNLEYVCVSKIIVNFHSREILISRYFGLNVMYSTNQRIFSIFNFFAMKKFCLKKSSEPYCINLNELTLLRHRDYNFLLCSYTTKHSTSVWFRQQVDIGSFSNDTFGLQA